MNKLVLNTRSILRQKLQTKIAYLSTPRQPNRSFVSLRKMVGETKINSMQQRRTFITPRRLRNLEAEANNSPGNPASQAAYLRELSKSKPNEVCRRVDSGAFASNEAVMKEYMKALVATGRIDHANLASIMGGGGQSSFQSQYGNGGNGGNGGMFESANNSFGAAGTFGGNMSGNGSGMGGGGGGFDAGMGGMMGQQSGVAPVMVQLVPHIKTKGERTWDMIKGIGSFILPAAILYYIYTQYSAMSGGKKGGGMLGMMAPKHIEPATSDKTFDDVKGCDEAKAELQEIADYLEDPDKFTKLGGKLPKGVLLLGPPGTGKTLLAKAIAGEAGVPFFFTSGSEFDEIFVGMGAKRVREIFATAKKQTPCIIFIDEIDAVGGKRNAKDQQAMKQTLNMLLVELDGFEDNEGLIVIGATNFPESLDPALIRPGRFDRHVNVDLPDIRGRKAILDHYLTTIVAERDDEGNIICDTDAIARTTPGSSGADLANMINAAALKASTDGKEFVTQLDLEYARDKITMGAEQTSAFITVENKKNTAYHEAGHAIVCMKTPGANTIHKATVIPHGQSLGMVQQLMEGDQKSKSMKQMLAYMDVCMGGRIAEEYINGKQNVTSGASQDLRQATATAQRMVMLFGMSEKVGKVSIGDLNMVSPKTRQLIDEEVKRLTDESYARATACIKKYSKEHKIIAEALIEYETLSGEELHDLIQGKKIRINNPISAEEKAKRIANANII